jgi:hypothetical protein
MGGIELEYRVGEVNGYKCRCCGHHLGSRRDDEDMSNTGFEEWSFCPYCAVPLYDEYNMKGKIKTR